MVSEIDAFKHPDGRTDRQTDMAQLTRLLILIKNIYTFGGRPRPLLPVTYTLPITLYPFCPFLMGSGYKNK